MRDSWWVRDDDGDGELCTMREGELSAVELSRKGDNVLVEVRSQSEASVRLPQGNEAASRTGRPSRYNYGQRNVTDGAHFSATEGSARH